MRIAFKNFTLFIDKKSVSLFRKGEDLFYIGHVANNKYDVKSYYLRATLKSKNIFQLYTCIIKYNYGFWSKFSKWRPHFELKLG